MKTPEEIKKGLGAPIGIHYHDDPEPRLTPRVLAELRWLHDETLALIQRLEADNAKKDETIQMLQDGNASLMKMIDEECEKTVRLERERDAAIRDCARFPCYTCNEREIGDFCPQCRALGTFRTLHEWRGPCEENGGLPELKEECNDEKR